MILHVISSLTTGGAETTLVQVAGALQARGLPQHVVAITRKGDNVSELKARGIDVTLLNVNSVTGASIGVMRVARLIRRLDARVVQGWMYHGNLVAALAHRLARRRKQRRHGLRDHSPGGGQGNRGRRKRAPPSDRSKRCGHDRSRRRR